MRMMSGMVYALDPFERFAKEADTTKPFEITQEYLDLLGYKEGDLIETEYDRVSAPTLKSLMIAAEGVVLSDFTDDGVVIRMSEWERLSAPEGEEHYFVAFMRDNEYDNLFYAKLVIQK